LEDWVSYSNQAIVHTKKTENNITNLQSTAFTDKDVHKVKTTANSEL
jgi:hypothetical protein